MYQIAGSINSLMVFVSLLGVFSQLSLVWRRKQDPAIKHSSELLSSNQFFVSFLAYFSFFVYGYSITPFNHFIVWPRLIAACLVCLILWEIFVDRKDRISSLVFGLSILALLLGLLGLLLNYWYPALTYYDTGQVISTAMIVTITLFLAQGYYHQIRLVIISGRTGALSLKMSQFIGLMDLSTIWFALTMELAASWPLLLLASVSCITKLIIMYLFYWVKVSPLARQRAVLSNT